MMLGRTVMGWLRPPRCSPSPPVNTLLDVAEQVLRPLRHIRIDSQHIALLPMITISTIPVLAWIAHDVCAAQRARGTRANLRTLVLPFLIVSLKHTDQFGEALAARGVAIDQ